MKLFKPTLVLLALGTPALAFDTPKRGDKTKDVIAYASAHSEFPEHGFNRFDCAGCTAFKNAVFVAAVSSCGTASCNYLLFEKNGQEAIYKTSIDLKAGAFEFLNSAHHGLPDLKVYYHLSADNGLIRIMRFDGEAYKDVRPRKKVAAGQFDKEIIPEKVTVTTK